MSSVDVLTVNTMRILSAETVQKAKSGHPGLPMGAAPIVYTLFAKHLKHNPENSKWPDRDRFILSAGHGSTLLYSALCLFGYKLSTDDLKQFRQFESLTPGHPEFGHTDGVEITTGPLGQGFANAVGFALAESYLAEKFNKPGKKIVDHYTYALCGDGCMMEGITSEAASLAGTLGLSKLIVFYDSNNITIEGSTDIAFCEDVGARFRAYNWHVIKVEDGNDLEAISAAIEEAKSVTDKPSLIEVKTQIGFGSPNKCGKPSAHGEPLGEEELKLTKKNLGWDYEEEFYIPTEVREHMSNLAESLKHFEDNWTKLCSDYKNEYPEDYKAWEAWHSDELLVDLLEDNDFWQFDGNLATRISSEVVLNRLSGVIPNLIGGSADLSPSTKTVMKDREYYSKTQKDGSNIHFGIREHAMTAIANGMSAHGGLIPYIAGFFVFSDYMKPSLRLSALMNLQVINVLTHDSIGVGEDGPTHQPIEQLASLRSIPGFTVFRPCDSKETAASWYAALTNRTGPTALVLTRQNLTLLDETGKNALKGGYILRDSEGTPDIILIASGSEVELIYKAYDLLKEQGVNARVVSMPSFELFDRQPLEYREAVLPKSVSKRLAVEAASGFGWHKYAGLDGDVICMDTYGASAPFSKLFEKYGFTVSNVTDRALKLLGR